jgi:hypothetical protein
MYVIPSDFYDSLMKKNKITEDPLIAAQIKMESEKSNIFRNKKDPDAQLAVLSNIAQKQSVLEEQRKKQLSIPTPVSLISEPVEVKKRGRPPKVPKESFFEYEKQMGLGLADIFYEFEPRGKKRRDILKTLRKTYKL